MQEGGIRGSRIARETSNLSETYRMESEILDDCNIRCKAINNKVKTKDGLYHED